MVEEVYDFAMEKFSDADLSEVVGGEEPDFANPDGLDPESREYDAAHTAWMDDETGEFSKFHSDGTKKFFAALLDGLAKKAGVTILHDQDDL